MQLNVTTDYAIKIVLDLAKKNAIANSNVISDAMRIPAKYVLNITRKLVAYGIINRKVGAAGGFSLNKEKNKISLYEIINSLEPTMNINRCLEDDEYCSRFATINCPLRKFYQKLQRDMENSLKTIFVMDLVKE